MSHVFAGAGFTVRLLEQNRWSELPLSADLFAEPFRRLSDDDLKTSGAVVLLTKGSR